MVVQMNGELKIKAEQIIDDAYNKGKNDAKREISLSGEYERAFQRGLDDAWDALRKMVRYFHSSRFNYIFGDKNFNTVITQMSASEVISILEAYEKKDVEKRICSYIQKPCPYEIECAECEVQCSYDRACKKAEVRSCQRKAISRLNDLKAMEEEEE